MDPLSQGVVGAVASQNVARRKLLGVAALLGFLSGLTPDLDILIRSDTDPLLFLEYHRQFTHSLIFIPVGGFICAALLYVVVRRFGLSFWQTFIFCTAGYATHALLDACTSYGTQLFWPFSDMRIAWSNISIIDPLFTVPLLLLVLGAVFSRKKLLARLAVVWVLAYLVFGLVQQQRVVAAGMDLAKSRGHNPIRLEAKPSFGNLLVWKVIYETEGQFHVDAIRMFVETGVYPGEAIRKLDTQKDFPWLEAGSVQANDINRFSWFSDGYLAVHPQYPNRIIDVRYSLLPNRIDGLWMIELDPDKDSEAHVGYIHEKQDVSGSVDFVEHDTRPE